MKIFSEIHFSLLLLMKKNKFLPFALILSDQSVIIAIIKSSSRLTFDKNLTRPFTFLMSED